MNTRPGSLKVLLADDDEVARPLIAHLLRQDGHQVIEARDGRALMTDLALIHLQGSESARDIFVVTDFHMPVADGLSVIREAHARGQNPPFVLISGLADSGVRQEANRLGALAVLEKPFDVETLRRLLRKQAQRSS